ncbi:hypothetical protein ACFPOI_02420 [Nonomuraea angiospora]|uniref:Uncharacterized protein n=1 Tax=Nonomuraea angiospora TaxID=46172 RepID=A0ABR9M2Z9_9ACTN|nr:hypothetical protein [Nonomuraea angiospora]MBE1587264.1 hypothetical protein [Nonomuraea angiospora]
MFNERPQLVVEVLRDLLGVELPATPLVRLEKTTFNTRRSDDIESDVVVVLGPPQAPAHAIIVEVQQDKSKDPKQLARYAAALWLMLRCDVTVLLVCPDRGVADHYAPPVESGLTGYRLQAQVLGPDDIPVITDPQEAVARPALAIMAVMAHGRDRKVVEAFAMALAELRDEHATKYYEYAYSMSAPDVRRLLEEIIMTSATWPVYSPFAREHYGRGQAEGKAEEAVRMLLLVLGARGFDISDDMRTRFSTCADLAQLESWATRAVTAQSLEDLFDETGGQHS